MSKPIGYVYLVEYYDGTHTKSVLDMVAFESLELTETELENDGYEKKVIDGETVYIKDNVFWRYGYIRVLTLIGIKSH